MLLRQSTLSVGCLVLATCLLGCSEKQKPPVLADSVKVTGTVTLDDKPLDGVLIRFVPTTDKGWHGAAGQTDSAGKYEPYTEVGNDDLRPGIIPGTYVVRLSRMVKSDGTLVPPNSNEPPMMSGARDSIPNKYNTERSLIKVTIPPSGGTFDFKLTSK
jgi:hypothetical protein